MKKNINKSAFTLVELITVMSIIAILAAIVVPTTFHYIKEANVTKELSEMNASKDIQGIFVDAKTNNIDITETTSDEKNKLSYYLTNLSLPFKSLGVIELSAIGETNNWKIQCKLIGQEYGAILNFNIDQTFTDEEIFNGSKSIPVDTITIKYLINKEDGSIVINK